MKFTELSDYPVPAGTVTIWTPTTDADPAGWQSDPRPFTYDQVALTRRASESGSSDENCWLGSVFEVHDRFDADLLRRTMRLWLERHEALLSAPDVPAPDPGALPADGTVCAAPTGRRTYRGEHVDIDTETLGEVPTGPAVAALLSTTFGARLSPTRWPHCLIATIEPTTHPADESTVTAAPGGGFTVIFAADHMVMDAYSIMLGMNEIRQIYHGLSHGLPTELPAVGSHVDFGSHDRSVGVGLTGDHPAVARWRDFLGRSEDYPEFGLPLMRPYLETCARPSETPRQRGISEYIATEAQADRIGATVRSAGYSSKTAVFAALAITYRMLTGRDKLRVTMPMHTRHLPQYAGSVGWYVGLAPLEIDLGSTETFDDALAATASGIEAARHLPSFPYRRIAELLGTIDEPEFVVSYLDVRHVPGSAEWQSARAQILRGSARSDREVYMWIARVPSGISLSARYPGHDPADESIRAFLATYTSILRTLAAEGTGLALSEYTGPASIDNAQPA